MSLHEIREQRRLDKITDRAEARKDAEADRKARRQDEKDRDQRREQRKARRAAQVRSVWAWVTERPLALAQVVLVVAPGILAWTAMSAYGLEVYGGAVGLLLPLLTEVGMWQFSFARQHARKAGRPTVVLTAGLIGTMAAAAGMAYLHGSEVSVRHGLVMATVNISGVLVHQALVHADRDKATPQQRRARQFQRAADRKAHRVRKRALRDAPVEVDDDGHASVDVEPGRIDEQRRWFGLRTNVRQATYTRALPVAGDEEFPTDGERLVAGVEQYLRLSANTEQRTRFSDASADPVPRPADQERERGGDTPEERGQERPEQQQREQFEERVRGKRRNGSGNGTSGRADGPSPAGAWTWNALVNAFKLAIDDGTVNPRSQRNVAKVMKCSKSRAAELVNQYENRLI